MNSGPAELSSVLKRFLCARNVYDAPKFVADALSISPDDDASLLLKIGEACPAMLIALLRGNLSQVLRLVGPGKVNWGRAEEAMRLMLIYYGALELQLIAARARAIKQFGFGVGSRDNGLAVGGLLEGWSTVMTAIEYAETTARTGKRPPGRTPRLISHLKWKARHAARASGLPQEELLQALGTVLTGIIAPLLGETARPAIEQWRATAIDKRQPKGSRLKIPTLLDGKTSGEQISFASLRLEALSTHARSLIRRNGTSAEDFVAFNDTKFQAGADGPSLKLYFANQVVIVENSSTSFGNLPLHFRFCGYSNNDNGGQSATAIKAVRKDQAWFLAGRQIVSRSMKDELKGAQRWDVLPDYRLGISPTSLPSTSDQGVRTGKYELPEHRRKFGITRQPSAQVRHYGRT